MPSPSVLVDRPLEAVHTVAEDLEETVEDPVPVLGIELLGQLGRPLHVREEHRHLLALALEGGLRLKDLVGQVLGGVVAWVACGPVHSLRCGGLGAHSRASPDEGALVPHRHLLDLHQFLDQLVERLVVERELALQHAERDPALLLEQGLRPADGLDKAHETSLVLGWDSTPPERPGQGDPVPLDPPVFMRASSLPGGRPRWVAQGAPFDTPVTAPESGQSCLPEASGSAGRRQPTGTPWPQCRVLAP